MTDTTNTAGDPFAPNPDPLYTIGQAAVWLNVSETWVRARITDGTIRAHRLRHLVRIPLSQLQAVLERDR